MIKETKWYSLIPLLQLTIKYSEINIDLPMQSNFQDKKYFFMFKDGATWGTESLTGSEKREWLGYLKIYYYQTKSISIKK